MHPICGYAECGPDQCNGQCGYCGSGRTCVDRVCEVDCPANSTCDDDSQVCRCNAGYVVGPDRRSCRALGGACLEVTELGYCESADRWIWCERSKVAGSPIVQNRLRALRCGETFGTACDTVDPDSGAGACGCGWLTEDGACGEGRDGTADKALSSCLNAFDVVSEEGCTG